MTLGVIFNLLSAAVTITIVIVTMRSEIAKLRVDFSRLETVVNNLFRDHIVPLNKHVITINNRLDSLEEKVNKHEITLLGQTHIEDPKLKLPIEDRRNHDRKI